MKQNQPALQLRRLFLARSASALAALGAAACGTTKSQRGITFRMGERSTVGKLIYNVTEASWKTDLGTSQGGRVAEHRFLVLRMAITNSGGDQVAVPLLSVFDTNGKSYRELDNGEGVEGWFGLVRLLKPVETQQGAIVFDVPRTTYRLQITDGGDPENENIAYVEIPLEMESDPVLSEPPAIPLQKK